MYIPNACCFKLIAQLAHKSLGWAWSDQNVQWLGPAYFDKQFTRPSLAQRHGPPAGRDAWLVQGSRT